MLDSDEPIAELQARMTGNISRFLYAGKSSFTVLNPARKTKYKFRVVHPDDKEPEWGFFVYAWMDRENGYKYLGRVNGRNEFFTTAGCKFDQNGVEKMAFEYVHANRMSVPDRIEVWHHGRCGVCGRALEHPDSIAIGIGPICMKGMKSTNNRQEKIFD